MTNDQFDLLCQISGCHKRGKETRELARKVLVSGENHNLVAKEAGTSVQKISLMVNRLKSVKQLVESYHKE